VGRVRGINARPVTLLCFEYDHSLLFSDHYPYLFSTIDQVVKLVKAVKIGSFNKINRVGQVGVTRFANDIFANVKDASIL
jgi:hypothetical protein